MSPSRMWFHPCIETANGNILLVSMMPSRRMPGNTLPKKALRKSGIEARHDSMPQSLGIARIVLRNLRTSFGSGPYKQIKQYRTPLAGKEWVYRKYQMSNFRSSITLGPNNMIELPRYSRTASASFRRTACPHQCWMLCFVGWVSWTGRQTRCTQTVSNAGVASAQLPPGFHTCARTFMISEACSILNNTNNISPPLYFRTASASFRECMY